jgi:hypothetical protein
MEIGNPALRNFRVAAGTKTEANRLALVALVLKGHPAADAGHTLPLLLQLPSIVGSLATNGNERRRSLK